MKQFCIILISLLLCMKMEAQSPEAKQYLHQGVLLAEEQKYREALVMLDSALFLFPEYAEAYYNSGLIYKTLNEHRQVLRNMSIAVFLDNNLQESYYIRGLSYYTLHVMDSALTD